MAKIYLYVFEIT